MTDMSYMNMLSQVILLALISLFLTTSCETGQTGFQQGYNYSMRDTDPAFRREVDRLTRNGRTLPSSNELSRAIDPMADCTSCAAQRNAARLPASPSDAPPPGGPVNTELPMTLGTNDILAAGYQRYTDQDARVYGTQRTIWRLQEAGRRLASQNIIMGVGDISSRGGPTNGHRSHQTGKDVDLRLVNHSGTHEPCTISRRDCFNRPKTLKMIKTLIDVDPQNVRVILINDQELINDINKYARSKGIGNVAMPEEGHHNHVHFSWK